MKKSKKFTLSLLIVILSVSMNFAQAPFQAGLNFTTGFPQNHFKDNIGNTAFGGTGYFAYKFDEVPFSIGLSVSVLGYGSETRREPLSTTILDVVVDVTTTNLIVSPYLLTRFQSFAGNIRPYGELLIGFNFLTTNTHIEDEVDGGISSNDYYDYAFSYGAGYGVLIQLYSFEEKNKVLFLDAGVRYLKGGEAEYLTKDSKTIDGMNVTYDVYKSVTDAVNGYIGVSFAF